MKYLILALSTTFSLSAFATRDSHMKFYYPFSHLQGVGVCMGTHLFHDGISNLESMVRGTLGAVKSRVNVENYGSQLQPRNINLLVVGPDGDLFKVETVKEDLKDNYVLIDVVLDFANAKKLDKSVQEQTVVLAYYSIAKSLAAASSGYYSINLRLNNSPVSFIGDINLTEPNYLSPYLADQIKLELQKAGILAIDSYCP